MNVVLVGKFCNGIAIAQADEFDDEEQLPASNFMRFPARSLLRRYLAMTDREYVGSFTFTGAPRLLGPEEAKAKPCKACGGRDHCNVYSKNWQNTKLDVVVRLRGETRTLAIPRLYDKVRFSRVIKKKAKLIVCLEKLRRAPWPQLAWDPKRDDEHRDAAERARGTGMR
jgi:hypothetical protein